MSGVLDGNVLIERLLEQALEQGDGDGECECPMCGCDGLTIDEYGDMLFIQCCVCGWCWIEEDECVVCVEPEERSMIISVQPDYLCHVSF